MSSFLFPDEDWKDESSAMSATKCFPRGSRSKSTWGFMLGRSLTGCLFFILKLKLFYCISSFSPKLCALSETQRHYLLRGKFLIFLVCPTLTSFTRCVLFCQYNCHSLLLLLHAERFGLNKWFLCMVIHQTQESLFSPFTIGEWHHNNYGFVLVNFSYLLLIINLAAAFLVGIAKLCIIPSWGLKGANLEYRSLFPHFVSNGHSFQGAMSVTNPSGMSPTFRSTRWFIQVGVSLLCYFTLLIVSME